MKIDDYWINEILGPFAQEFTEGKHISHFIKIKDVTEDSLIFCYDDMLHHNNDYSQRFHGAMDWLKSLPDYVKRKFLPLKLSEMTIDPDSKSDDAAWLKVTKI